MESVRHIGIRQKLLKAPNAQKRDGNACDTAWHTDLENIRCLSMASPKSKARGAGDAQTVEGPPSSATKFRHEMTGAVQEICQISVGPTGQRGNVGALGAS